MLLSLLFPAQPFVNFQQLFESYRDQIDIEGRVGISHLQNLQTSFDTLKNETFDKQVRSNLDLCFWFELSVKN